MSDYVIAGVKRCPYCKQKMEINENNQMWFNEHYYHNDCFLQFYNKALHKNGEKAIEDKAALLAYAYQIFNMDYMQQKFSLDLVGLLRKKFTYQGILASLNYQVDIKKLKISENYGIGIVNFIYLEAKRYYENMYNQKEKLQSQLINNVERIVIVKKIKDAYEQKQINIKLL